MFRKLLNLWAVFIPVTYYLVPEKTGRTILLLITVVVVIVDFGRIHVNGIKEAFIIFFGSFLRRHELTRLSGATYLLIGCLITALIFPKSIFIAASAFTIVGDTFAAIIGQSVKGPKIFKKTLSGTIAFLLSCLIVVAVIYFFGDIPLYVLLIGALAAAILEALPLPWDDNFALPLCTAVILSLFQ